jgi:TIR domain
MADVFISYAKADRPLALKLAAMLEAEGWTTWWDTSLIPGDDFRNEIMTELGRARAVVVIWTDASIKSDWVRSEAGRAQADRKLIPVKLPHLTYKDLPPPFDVLHTENVGEEDKIKAAVVAQLAKPAVEPTAVGLLTKGFKWEVLTWWGSLVDEHPPVFLVNLLVNYDLRHDFDFDLSDVVNAMVIWIGWLFAPPVLIALFSRERLHGALSVFLIFIFFIIIVLLQVSSMGATFFVGFPEVAAVSSIWGLALILLSAAPAKAVSRRLIFLALGLLLLIGLNELSKLGLDLTAPKLQG